MTYTRKRENMKNIIWDIHAIGFADHILSYRKNTAFVMITIADDFNAIKVHETGPGSAIEYVKWY